MNIQAIWETLEYMEKEPRRINMIDSIASAADAKCWDIEEGKQPCKRVLQLPPCNTVCCFAGAAVLSHRPDLTDKESWLRVKSAAMEILDLNPGQAERLFHLPATYLGTGTGWPKDDEKAYIAANTPEERAQVLRKRVQRFVDTNGAE
jgi:hypothetical protein